MARPVRRKSVVKASKKAPSKKAVPKKAELERTLPKQAASATSAPIVSEKALRIETFLDQLRHQLDANWYINFYGVLLDQNVKDQTEAAIQHYLRIGARNSFSPCRAFDEVAYRILNTDVDLAVSTGEFLSGYQHYANFGKAEKRQDSPIVEVSRWKATHPMYSDTARIVRSYFDARWYTARYPEVAEELAKEVQPSPLMHYLTEGLAKDYSPNEWFDESWYLTVYPDVAQAKEEGSLACGFVHFLSSGRAEGRHAKANTQRELESKYPGLTRPVALEAVAHVEAKIAPLKTSYRRVGEKRLNVLIPTLDKNIMFGGYIALLNFLIIMQQRGWPIRLIVLEDADFNLALSRLQFAKDANVSRLLATVEVVNATKPDCVVEITSGDRFIAYSMWMAHRAHQLAQMNNRRFIFFVQEFEPIFHAYDTWHALGASAYLKPHFAIFNSFLLRNYFRDRRYGVFSRSTKDGEASSAVFQHALSVTGTPSLKELDHGKEKRLLFYARPEAHAARNLFEIGLIALKRAIAEGVFGQEWTFDGVGTLGTEGAIDLGGGRYLHLRPKLDIGDYCAALRRYDLGLSLMYAPHPSVVPFEMAASGLVVVTNVFENRDEQILRKISTNFVPSELSIEALTEALSVAEGRVGNLKERVAGAARPWVTNWQASFSTTFLNSVEKELNR